MLTMKLKDLQTLNFTRRHFEFVANLIGEIADDDSRDEVTHDTCIRFKAAFDRFDEKRFRDHVQEVHKQCYAEDSGWYTENFHSDV